MTGSARCVDCGRPIAEEDQEAGVYMEAKTERVRFMCGECRWAHRWTRQLARALGR